MAETIRGMDELNRNLDKLKDRMADKLEAATKAGASLVQNDAKKKAPKLSTNLSRSIHMETTEKTDARVVVEVGTDVEYARIQEFGGTIHAQKGPYLTFKTKDGHWVRTPSVQIPPHPYLRPALDENSDKVKKEIREALADVLKGTI